MTDKIEIPYNQIIEFAGGRFRPAAWNPASFEVDGPVLSIRFPVAGTCRITKHGWDELVQRVNEAFIGEPVEDEEDTYGASEEMRKALSELPVETLEAYRCKACHSYYEGIHFPHCPMYASTNDRDRCWECGRLEEDTCSNCEQYPSEGHEPNCMAGPP